MIFCRNAWAASGFEGRKPPRMADFAVISFLATIPVCLLSTAAAGIFFKTKNDTATEVGLSFLKSVVRFGCIEFRQWA
jgi:hypothetical protein